MYFRRAPFRLTGGHVRSCCVLWYVLILFLGASAWTALQAAEPEPLWLTGTARQQALNRVAGLTWAETGLRVGLSKLAQTQRIAIWLDRRIDPDQTYTISAAEMPLGRLLQQIGERAGGEVAWLGDVAYLGPPELPARLVTTAILRQQEAAQLPAIPRGRMMQVAASAWPELTTPRELIAQWAREAQIRVRGGELLPHDLWAAGSLPPLSWTDRVCLVLAGFELTYEFAPDGSAIRLLPLPTDPVLSRTLTLSADAEKRIEPLKQRYPAVSWERQGKRLLVSGRYDHLEEIASQLRGEPVPGAVRTGERRYTLEVMQAPAAAVLAELVRRESIELQSDPGVDPILRQPISLKVTEVTLPELLDKTLHPIGVRYVLTGKHLRLFLMP